MQKVEEVEELSQGNDSSSKSQRILNPSVYREDELYRHGNESSTARSHVSSPSSMSEDELYRHVNDSSTASTSHSQLTHSHVSSPSSKSVQVITQPSKKTELLFRKSLTNQYHSMSSAASMMKMTEPLLSLPHDDVKE